MKRIFTDADIYEDEWYQNLINEHKLLWDYICRRAEYGFWKPNWGLVTYQLKVVYDPAKALNDFNSDSRGKKQRVVVLDNGRWFIPSWVPFQYKNLSLECKAHKPVFDYYKANYPKLFDSYLIAIGYQQEKEKEQSSEGKEKRGSRGDFEKPSEKDLIDAFTAGGLEPASAKREASRFKDYFESVGWKVGRSLKPMKSWRGAVSTWITNRRPDQEGAEKPERKYKKDCKHCDGKGHIPPSGKECWCWRDAA